MPGNDVTVPAIDDVLQPDRGCTDHEISMIILCGGSSSRMGRNKAELVYGGKTFLEIQIEKGLALGVSSILLAGFRGSLYDLPILRERDFRVIGEDRAEGAEPAVKIRIIKDRYPGCGPLGGMEACLREAPSERSLVICVDAPLLPVSEMKKLIAYSRSSSAGAVLIKGGGRIQPLMGVYARHTADEMVRCIKAGNRAVMAALQRTGYEVYESSCPDPVFRNINTPEDYLAL